MFEGFYDGRPAKRADLNNQRLDQIKAAIEEPGIEIWSYFLVLSAPLSAKHYYSLTNKFTI